MVTRIIVTHWKNTGTLGYWTNYNGTTLPDAITQWSSSGNAKLICIIWTPWKTTWTTSTVGCRGNHTGWCYLPAMFQLQISGNLHSKNILEDHWKTTGMPLEQHWLLSSLSLAVFQCKLVTKFQAHWIATGLQLNYQGRVGAGNNLQPSMSQS